MARKALAIRPDDAEAYWRLAVNLNGRLSESEERSIVRLIEEPYLPRDSLAVLHFSLATARDRGGMYAEAAALFDRGHAIQSAWRTSRGQIYDAANQSQLVDRMIAAFPAGAFGPFRHPAGQSTLPVFVVGLPRSGTTLVEQVLASHPAVWGAGEVPDLFQVFKDLPELLGRVQSTPIEALEHLNADVAETMARQYTERVAAFAPAGKARVVDKTPDNIRLLGVIGKVLPGARVILCTRDLRDVAVSCRTAAFNANFWSNDWQHLAQRFADYQRILAHWRIVQPIDWLEISYEECVRDLEGHARRMIAFLGLEWDPACLDFAKTRRVVKTASLAQVREPIHDRSVGRWRRYESWHKPMIAAFRAHGVEYDNPA